MRNAILIIRTLIKVGTTRRCHICTVRKKQLQGYMKWFCWLHENGYMKMVQLVRMVLTTTMTMTMAMAMTTTTTTTTTTTLAIVVLALAAWCGWC